MSHIYVYSPSSAVRDKAAFRRGIARLKALGHEVEVDPSALSSHMRFAGDDATRIEAIARAAASGANVALTSRGGYGLTRILADLPYRKLARAVERGTHFVGLSDFTALQCALLAKTGAQTWAGPAVGEDFGCESVPDDIMLACFDDLVCGQGEGSGWRLPMRDVSALATRPARAVRGAPLTDGSAAASGTDGATDPQPFSWHVGKAVLWGGNLAVLASLVGTPWLPRVRGGVLYLEDVNEHPYRVERLLTQLLHAGVLGQQKAVLLGSFNRYQLSKHDRGFKLQTVVDWLRSKTRVPVLTGLPFGHVPTKVLLPMGRPVELLVQQREALLFWG